MFKHAFEELIEMLLNASNIKPVFSLLASQKMSTLKLSTYEFILISVFLIIHESNQVH